MNGGKWWEDLYDFLSMVGNGGKILNSECDRCSATFFRQRPYSVEHTRSHLNSEVKQPKARSVLGWGTAWEVLRVLLAFLIDFFEPNKRENK